MYVSLDMCMYNLLQRLDTALDTRYCLGYCSGKFPGYFNSIGNFFFLFNLLK